MNFKAGDIVMCISTHDKKSVVAGREYLITGFACCPNCGRQAVFVQGYTYAGYVNTKCDTCSDFVSRGKPCFAIERFVKPNLNELKAILEKENVCS